MTMSIGSWLLALSWSAPRPKACGHFQITDLEKSATPKNRSWFEQEVASIDQNSAVFDEDAVPLTVIWRIFDHHPDWTQITVRGVDATSWQFVLRTRSGSSQICLGRKLSISRQRH